ncbi:hypothetical protein BH11GEM2_BH11GEM2_31770 [soil metagenome]|jgi:hypothetical protein
MLYLISFDLSSTKDEDASRAFFDKLRSWSGHEFAQHTWLVVSDKLAMVLFLELQEHYDAAKDLVIIAEITSNTFGTFVLARNLELTGLIAAARHR